MTKIIRRTRKRGSDFPCGVFFLGICFGSTAVYLLLTNNEIASSTSSTTSVLQLQNGQQESLSSNLKGRTNQQRGVLEVTNNKNNNERGTNNIHNDAGWKNINIFYGEEVGLYNTDLKEKLNTYHAQVNQDKVVLDLLGNDGYFIDLAANDALKWTNTLALEKVGNWNGLCIEPNPVYWYGLSHRKCTVVGALIGGNDDDENEKNKKPVEVKFRGVFGGIVGKMDEKLANRKREPDAIVEKRYLKSFKSILTEFGVPEVIDYLSLDVEGAEFLVMEYFPFTKYTVRVLTIERPDKKLKDLLIANDYIFLKDLAWWGETLWAHKSTGFTPTHPKIIQIQTEERN